MLEKDSKIKNKLIFITSIENWGNTWFSKQHYAHELSKNNTVYFLNGVPHWRIKDLFSFSLNITVINETLYSVSYRNNFPIRIFKGFFLFLNDTLNSWKLKRIINQYPNKPVIFWLFDPGRFITIPYRDKIKLIYHVVDPYTRFKTDKLLAKKADIIVSVSKKLAEPYASHTIKTLIIPHGISNDALTIDEKNVSSDLTDCIMYVGSIYSGPYGINFELLNKIADVFTDRKLVIIGKIIDLSEEALVMWEALKKRDNFLYINEVHSNTLQNYIILAKVCIIPYIYSKTYQHLFHSSHKFYNYIAQFKPVVSCMLHDLEYLNGKVIHIASNDDEFITYLKAVVYDEIKYDSSTAQKFINDNSYDNHIKEIGEFLYKN